jgi:hypothetical protein
MWLAARPSGYHRGMTLLIILLLLALVFGVGAVIKGILWLMLLAFLLIAGLVLWGWYVLRRRSGGAVLQ